MTLRSLINDFNIRDGPTTRPRLNPCGTNKGSPCIVAFLKMPNVEIFYSQTLRSSIIDVNIRNEAHVEPTLDKVKGPHIRWRFKNVWVGKCLLLGIKILPGGVNMVIG